MDGDNDQHSMNGDEFDQKKEEVFEEPEGEEVDVDPLGKADEEEDPYDSADRDDSFDMASYLDPNQEKEYSM